MAQELESPSMGLITSRAPRANGKQRIPGRFFQHVDLSMDGTFDDGKFFTLAMSHRDQPLSTEFGAARLIRSEKLT